MTIEEKHDCLLGYLVELMPTPGTVVPLLKQDQVETAIERCEVSDRSELCSYIRSLEGRGFVRSNCAGDDTIVAAVVTMEGYSYVERLKASEGDDTPIGFDPEG